MADDVNEPIGCALTPCVRNCCLDENDICIGCHRSISEIIAWSGSTESEKREILIRCRLRDQRRQDKIKERSNQARHSRDDT
jgi:predicted Fe-S protein YdhL (DUF1289 family)